MERWPVSAYEPSMPTSTTFAIKAPWKLCVRYV